MRPRPYAFLRIGERWINMTMVTDIVDHDDRLVIYMATDMARRAAGETVDVARRYEVDGAADVEKLRKWLKLNDEE